MGLLDGLINKILGIDNSVLNSKKISSKKNINIKNPTINIQNVTINNKTPYKELRNKEGVKESIREYFEQEHKDDTSRLQFQIEKESGFNPLEHINSLLKREDIIQFIKKTKLNSNKKNMLINCIYHKDRLKKNNDFQKFKNEVSQDQMRYLNLYSSGWVEKLITHLKSEHTEKGALAFFEEDFEKLVNNKSLIFIHKFTTKDEIRRELLKQLNEEQYCILHCIGKPLCDFVEKSIKDINNELEGYDYSFICNRKKQFSGKGVQYEISINFDQRVIIP